MYTTPQGASGTKVTKVIAEPSKLPELVFEPLCVYCHKTLSNFQSVLPQRNIIPNLEISDSNRSGGRKLCFMLHI